MVVRAHAAGLMFSHLRCATECEGRCICRMHGLDGFASHQVARLRQVDCRLFMCAVQSDFIIEQYGKKYISAVSEPAALEREVISMGKGQQQLA